MKINVVDLGDSSVGFMPVEVFSGTLDCNMTEHLVDTDNVKKFAEEFIQFVNKWYEPEIRYMIEVIDKENEIDLEGVLGYDGKIFWTDLNQVEKDYEKESEI